MSAPIQFSTDGIRGDVRKVFTNQFAFDLGRTFAQFLDKTSLTRKKLVLGQDPRPSSQRIKQAFAAGFNLDWEIVDQGIIPTPALNLLTYKLDCAGIMVSGSHIMGSLNGIKFFIGPDELNLDEVDKFKQIYEKQKGQKSILALATAISKDDQARLLYFQMLSSLADSPFSFKVCIDTGNGSQTEIMPQVLSQLGVKVFKLNCSLKKPLLYRDTETIKVFGPLKRAVIDQKADLGMGYDVDGDRVIFIDGRGRLLPADLSFSILAQSSKENTLVTPINTSAIVETIGKKILRTKVGILSVIEAMRKNNTTLGFESNGGYVSGEIFYGRDGGSATIKMLNFLKKKRVKLEDLADQFPPLTILKEKIACVRLYNPKVFAAVKEKYGKYKIDKTDGLKVWIDTQSWILFRPSGNAPEFRVFAESPDPRLAKTLLKEGLNLVKSIISQNV